MKVWHVALAIVITFVVNTAFAQTTPRVEFDQKITNEIFVNHPEHVNFITTADDGNPEHEITNGELIVDGVTKTIPLKEYKDTGIYISPRIKFSTTIGEDDPVNHIYRVNVGSIISARVESTSSPSAIIVDRTGTQTYGNRLSISQYQICEGAIGTGGLGLTDADNDGICDEWETPAGTANTLIINYNPLSPGSPASMSYRYDCTTDLLNPTCDADDSIKDVFIEIDYMQGHRPNELAIKQVVDSFLMADGLLAGDPNGIRVHVQIDDADSAYIPHQSCTKFPGSNWGVQKGFDQIKSKYFGTQEERNAFGALWSTLGWHEKRQAFHYALFVHSQCNSGSSGVAEIRGNDMMISLGGFDGSIDQQSGTFMHELGHNLGLDHGGPYLMPNYNLNCKPNYLSVMSYSRQFADLVETRQLNYSAAALGPMNAANPDSLSESGLVETEGIEAYDTLQEITFGPNSPLDPPETGGPIDWDQSGGEPQETPIDPPLNINSVRDSETGMMVCPDPTTGDTLTGYDDWENLQFDIRLEEYFADGRQTASGEFVHSSACPPPEAVEAAGVDVNDYRICRGGVGPTPGYPEMMHGISLQLDELYQIIQDTNDTGANSTINLIDDLLAKNNTERAQYEIDQLRKQFKASYTDHKEEQRFLFDGSDEITADNVKAMRYVRINSLLQYIDNLKDLDDDGFNGDKTKILNEYKKTLKDIKKDIGNEAIGSASKKLQSLYKTYNIMGDDKITDIGTQIELMRGTDKILSALSMASDDPKITKTNTSPLQQAKAGVEPQDIHCSAGKKAYVRERLVDGGQNIDVSYICVKPSTAETLVSWGVAMLRSI